MSPIFWLVIFVVCAYIIGTRTTGVDSYIAGHVVKRGRQATSTN